jgi:hypothetical protein
MTRATSQVRDVVATIARELDDFARPLTEELAAQFLEEIPAFRGDESVRDLMAASTAANLSTIVDVLAHGLPVEPLDLPAAAAAYARRFAQRDLPVEGLLRAYRLGQVRVIRWCLRTLSETTQETGLLADCADEIVSVIGRYIDQISENLVELYATERKLWSQRSDTARAVALRAVLTDETLTRDTSELMLGYRLHGWHLALVAWVDPGTPHVTRVLESFTRGLARAHGAAPLAVLQDDHTLWAWVSGPGPLDTAALAEALTPVEPVNVALGETAAGLAGFRSSHREAIQTRAVAETPEQRVPSVTTFGDVGIAALLYHDLDALREWVKRTLGELARSDDATERLRDTVRVFLECGGSYTDAASRLHLHKNTIHYRVRKAEELRRRPLRERRLDVEVALLICHRLGNRVLAEPL